MKESQSCFRFYASGRRSCKGFLAEMNVSTCTECPRHQPLASSCLSLPLSHSLAHSLSQLRKRHDLFSALLLVLAPAPDTLSIEIAVNDDMAPFVFAILRRRDYKSLHSQVRDLADYAQVVPLELLPQSLVLLTDCPELIDERGLLPQKVVGLLKRTPWFISLHFTDQNATRSTGMGLQPHLLRFKFALPPAHRMGELQELVEMAIWYVDVVGNMGISKSARQKAEVRSPWW